MHVFARERERKALLPGLGARRILLRHRGGPDHAVVGQRDEDGVIGEQAQAALHDGIEHRLRVAHRIADDVEHLAGRGLLLQRLGEIVGALAQLVEQPRVLDGDDRLGGEVLHQFDLLVGEWPHLLAVDDNAPTSSSSLSIGTISSVRAPPSRRSATERVALDIGVAPQCRRCAAAAWCW